MEKDLKELIGQVTEPRFLWVKYLAYHWARKTGKYDRSVIESIIDGLTIDERLYYHECVLGEQKRIFEEQKRIIMEYQDRFSMWKKQKKNRFSIEDA